MWAALVTWTVFASCVLGQQHVLQGNNMIVEAATVSSTWSSYGSTNKAINPGVTSLAEELMRAATIKGLSIGVVLPDGSVETSALGIKSEYGDAMTADVSV